ncbi:MAG: hypothetical protein WBX03_03560 [Terriglobales bacterium]|jgi:hypothetical protein
MDLLITLIGNAAVDPFFRKRFLDNPVEITDAYGFRLTKGDFEMMKTIFADLAPTEKKALQKAFDDLQPLLYQKVGVCDPPCHHSIFPPPEPPELRKERETPEKVRKLEKGKAA